jgi:U4/U6 small nuclear ribonucleoprotein PRP3
MAEALIAKTQKQKKKIPENSLLAIQPEDIAKNNPYFDRRIGLKPGKDHAARPIHFNQRGKFISKANKARNEAQMKILEREIAESSAGAGLDVEIIADLLAMGVDQVPRAEWWDLPYLTASGQIDGSKITSLIHRPALIQPPADPNEYVPPKPLALTKEEQKKIRRQRRLEEQKDKQERIKLGLLPPDPPKIKIANLMNVLASESVQEPSKVEAQVREQAAQRKQAHEEANQNRKLTDEERSERNRQKMAEDTSHMAHVAVYFVKKLERPQWRFKVSMNAQQNHLTGCALMTPDGSLVIVEGGPKGLKRYNNLMLRRINWKEQDEIVQEDTSNANEMSDISPPPNPTSNSNEDNECRLLWEGSVTQPTWRRFEMKPITAQYDAKQYLCERGLESYWNLLKTWINK